MSSVRKPDPAILRLVVAAVRHGVHFEPGAPDEDHDAFMATDEELREAAIAYRRSLSQGDRKRIAATRLR